MALSCETAGLITFRFCITLLEIATLSVTVQKGDLTPHSLTKAPRPKDIALRS